MNTKYNIEKWAEETVLGRRVFNYNFRLTATEFKGWALIKTIALSTDRDNMETAYFFENKKDPKREVVRVDITERFSWFQAQSALQNELNGSMRPDIPNGTKDLARLGDVSFVTRQPESDYPTAISFVRGNVLILINFVGEKKSDMAGIAVQIDDTLSKVPTAAQMKKGKIHRLKPQPSNKKINGVYDLIDLTKRVKSKTWLQIIASDGELSRKGNVIIYKPETQGTNQVDVYEHSRD